VKGVRWDIEAAMSSPQAQAAMGRGDFGKVCEAVAPKEIEWWRQGGARRLFEEVRDFQPDLLISTPLEEMTSRVFAHILKKPCIGAWLQNAWPTKTAPTLVGEGHFHRLVWGLVVKEGFKQKKKALAMGFQEVFGKELAEADEFVGLETLANHNLDLLSPVEPHLLAVSEHLFPRPKDWPKSLSAVRFTGFWVVNRQEQEARLRRQDSKFGGQSLAQLTDFLGKGEAPAYVGWGSMTARSPEFMACLAVRSLKLAGLRGIVLGGWAKLSPEMLQGQPDTQELVSYAAERVLFVDSAPHEWLFPRCALTVHHGGAGTMAAAVRSGVPTVITPVFSDQFANAGMVQRSGCGVALPQLCKVKPKALAGAMKRCAGEKMRGRAAKLGERLQAEDGLGNATKVIDAFLRDEVATGNWAKSVAARRREHERIAAKKQGGCCG